MRALPAGLLHEVSRRLGLHVPEGHLRMAETREDVLDRAMARGRPTELVADSLKAIVWRSSMCVCIAA